LRRTLERLDTFFSFYCSVAVSFAKSSKKFFQVFPLWHKAQKVFLKRFHFGTTFKKVFSSFFTLA
jgi:hypothetical protein